jgi:hypothetical protein
MRFNTLILTLCILIPGLAFAQLGWERTYGDTGNDLLHGDWLNSI